MTNIPGRNTDATGCVYLASVKFAKLRPRRTKLAAFGQSLVYRKLELRRGCRVYRYG